LGAFCEGYGRRKRETEKSPPDREVKESWWGKKDWERKSSKVLEKDNRRGTAV